MGIWYIPAIQISCSRWHSANPASTSAKPARSNDQENTDQQPSFRTHTYCLEYSNIGLHSKSWKERPISLTSFLLKTVEKLVDVSIRTQHAYRAGRSTDTALYHLKSLIEDSLTHKEVKLCVFLGLQGAFNNTSHEAVNASLATRGLDATTSRWIKSSNLKFPDSFELQRVFAYNHHFISNCRAKSTQLKGRLSVEEIN